MSVKSKIKGFKLPFDLQYRNPKGSDNEKGTKLATWRTSGAAVVALDNQFQITVGPILQNFLLKKVQFDVNCVGVAGIKLIETVCAVFSSNTDLGVSYPAGSFQSNLGIVRTFGNPSNKDLIIDFGEGVIFQNGASLVLDVTSRLTAGGNFAVTDTISINVNLIWE